MSTRADIAALRAEFEAALALAVELSSKAAALHAKRLAWEMDPYREPDGRTQQVQLDHCDARREADRAWGEAYRVGSAYRWRALHVTGQ